MDFSDIFHSKTKVLLFGKHSLEAQKILQKVSEFTDRSLDFYTENEEFTPSDSDFIIYRDQDLSTDHNIIFLAEQQSAPEFLENIIDQLTDGGIFIFNDQNPTAVSAFEKSTKYFRAIPYSSQNVTILGSKIQLDTPFGILTIHNPDIKNPEIISGLRELSQHIAVSEEAFYESLI